MVRGQFLREAGGQATVDERTISFLCRPAGRLRAISFVFVDQVSGIGTLAPAWEGGGGVVVGGGGWGKDVERGRGTSSSVRQSTLVRVLCLKVNFARLAAVRVAVVRHCGLFD